MFNRKKKNCFASSVDGDAIAKLPLMLFRGKITVIDAPGADYNRAVRYLSRRRMIGFDTETRPVFTPHAPQNGVALLQLSSGRHAFLFRVHKLGLGDELAAILSNPKIMKIGAAVCDDIRGLQKIFPFNPAGFVDLQKICGDWGITDKSVKKMSAIIMGGRISKTQQLSNWEAPILSDAQKNYAATDAWICREMYLKLQSTAKLEPEKLEALRASIREAEAAKQEAALAKQEAAAAAAAAKNDASAKSDAAPATPAKSSSKRKSSRSATAKVRNTPEPLNPATPSDSPESSSDTPAETPKKKPARKKRPAKKKVAAEKPAEESAKKPVEKPVENAEA